MNMKKISKKKATVAAFVMMMLISISIAANVTADDDPQDPVFEGEVTVTLNATDDWSGVDYTMYYISFTEPGNEPQNDTGIWIEYSEPFVVSEMGHYNIGYYSVDLADNVEETKVTSFSIVGDITPPVTACILDGIIH